MIIPCCEIGSCNDISWLYTELPNGVAEAGYDEQLYPLGIKLPARYTLISGSLPDGLSLNESGLISGVLGIGSEGEYEFLIQVMDANRCSSTQMFTLTIEPQIGFYLVSNAPLIVSLNENKVSERWPIT